MSKKTTSTLYQRLWAVLIAFCIANTVQASLIRKGGKAILSIEDFGAVSDEALGLNIPSFHEFAILRAVASQVFHQKLHNHDHSDPLDLAELCRNNTAAFSNALQAAKPGDVVLVPDGKSYSFTGGIIGQDLDHITIDIAGSMHFVHDLEVWPFRNDSHYFRFRAGIRIVDSSNVTFTSSSQSPPKIAVDYRKNMVYMDDSKGSGGIINGNGKTWWDEAILGHLPKKNGDTRPHLIHIESSADILVEKLTLVNSPFWTLTVEAVRAEIRHVNVLVDRKYQTGPGDVTDWVGRRLHQPQDLNTDGIDTRGVDIWVHHCIVQNADDSVAVKPPVKGNRTTALHGTIPYACTRNVTIEHMILTGFGASIGSVGPTKHHACVDQVTFRNITMPGTGKGIYIKSDASDCHGGVSSQISNILYEDVHMMQPFWWPIWIGPQQQHEPNADMTGKCPLAYPLPGSKHCPTQGCTTFANITLRNIRIDDPVVSPGVILGNETNPIQNLVFENITVTASRRKPWHGTWPYHESHYPFRGTYQCKHAQGICKNCSPLPNCLMEIIR